MNLPELSKIAANDYFYKLDRLPFDNAVLLFNFYISKILCFNRVQIELEHDDFVFPNLYCINFGESGSGKDRSINRIEDITYFLFSEKKKMEELYIKQKMYEIEQEADDMGFSKAKKASYMADKKPRNLFSLIGSTGTPEGVASAHEALDSAGFGEMVWRDSEISDTMVRYKAGSPLDDLITIFKVAADVGKFNPKVIKGNKFINAQGKVPYLAWLHGAVDEDRGTEIFKSFLQLGFTRRSIICLSDDGDIDERSIDQIEEDKKSAIEEGRFLTKSLKEIYDRIKINLNYEHGGNKVFKLEPKAKRLYYEYERDCSNRAKQLSKHTSTLLKNDVANLYFKAIKLACVFAVQNHSDLIIKKEDLMQAIECIEYFNGHVIKFLGIRSKGNMTIAENMIISLSTNGDMKKTDFYKENYFPKYRNGQKKTFDENIVIAKEMLEDEGKMIYEDRCNKNTIMYRIVDIPEHQKSEVDTIRLSVGASDHLYETSFEAMDVPFDQLHTITGGENAYSASLFNKNKRAIKNWMGNNSLLIFDIDNDKGDQLTIDEAKTRFAGFANMICTTKSHQKEKKGNTTDRFRIILPITLCKLENYQFKEIIKNICNNYGLVGYCDIPASSDPSRMYMPHPEQQYWYNEGLIMNPFAFLYTEDKGEFKRNFPLGQTVKVRGKILGINEMILEAKNKGGRTIPCEAFCHEDNNPSAFFCINDHGNLQYTCTACGQSYFYKLR